MNQENNKYRFITGLLYIAIILLIIGYSLVRHGVQRSATIDVLFGFLGYAGYILAGCYLLIKTWNKSWVQLPFWNNALPLMGTIGLATGATYSITLLVNSSFLSGPIMVANPLLIKIVSIFCFFAVAGVFMFLIRVGDNVIQKKVPQWLLSVRSWETFFVLLCSIPFIVMKFLNSWEEWYRFRQTAQGIDLLALLPPFGIGICVFMVFVSLLFFSSVIRDAFKDSF